MVLENSRNKYSGLGLHYEPENLHVNKIFFAKLSEISVTHEEPKKIKALLNRMNVAIGKKWIKVPSACAPTTLQPWNALQSVYKFRHHPIHYV